MDVWCGHAHTTKGGQTKQKDVGKEAVNNNENKGDVNKV